MNRFGITLALLLIGQNLAAASAESRLEAAKNAMVDQALSQPTRVHSAALGRRKRRPSRTESLSE